MVITTDMASAIFRVARLTNTPYGEIVDTLIGVAFSEEDAGNLMECLDCIYGDFDNEQHM